MSGTFRVPAATVEVQEMIRRSRFITSLGRAASRAGASRFVTELRDRHPRATHYCWAFNAGPPGSTAHMGMSDAGEPHGTAGRPMLNALLHSELGEVVAACARYYGGVKLGTGGLVRAYGGGVSKALQICPTTKKTERVAVQVTTPYEAADRVKRLLDTLEATVTDRSFGTDVSFTALVPAIRRAELDAAVADVTAGRGLVLDRVG